MIKKLPTPAVVALAVLALAIVGYSMVTFLGPQKEYRPTTKPAVTADSEWIRETAKRVGGDASKLTPQERARADQITRGATDFVISAMAKEQP